MVLEKNRTISNLSGGGERARRGLCYQLILHVSIMTYCNSSRAMPICAAICSLRVSVHAAMVATVPVAVACPIPMSRSGANATDDATALL